ncbi:MAG: PilZ domain-containing protein [Candidatus Goldiibacteriota bacterium]|jgi:c-di-GMP-binding flagellar brake protein YcgR
MPASEGYLEKRKYSRVAKKLPVVYKIMAGDEFEKQPPELERRRTVHTEDISISGMQLICDENLSVDKILRLDIKIDNSQQLATFAEVRWSKKDDKLNKFRIGLEFLVIKEDHINIIKKISSD